MLDTRIEFVHNTLYKWVIPESLDLTMWNLNLWSHTCKVNLSHQDNYIVFNLRHLSILSCSPGNNPHGNSMMSTSTSAFFSVLKGWSIQFKPLHEKGLSYTSINIARCTFSAILDPCGVSRTSSLVSTQISRGSWKAFFTECRLPQPRYNKSWDVYIVLQHILSMDESNKLPLKDFTKKLAMLVTLTTAQSGQSIHLMDI